jgi:putative transposase
MPNRNPLRRLLEVLAGSSQAELHRQVQYLKAENEVLRSQIAGPVRVTPQERSRLVRLGKPLDRAIGTIVSIVKPETFRRWMRDDAAKHRARRKPARRPGRPRTPEQVRGIVLRMARENSWGYSRILGELKKIGIKVARGTVVNILKEAGLPTSPERGESTWDQFVKRHARTLWVCDFLRVRTLTTRGFRDAFVLVFIHPKSRRVIVSPSTLKPDAAWVAEQARDFAAAAPWVVGRARILLRDSDSKFGKAFDESLRACGVRPFRLPHRSPNLNAFEERFIQTLQTECLDHFVVLGTAHLDHLTTEFVEHYLRERPHLGLDSRTPFGSPLRLTAADPLLLRASSASRGWAECSGIIEGRPRECVDGIFVQDGLPSSITLRIVTLCPLTTRTSPQ